MCGACCTALNKEFHPSGLSGSERTSSLHTGLSGSSKSEMRFGDIKQLLAVKGDPNFAAVTSSLSCLSVIAQSGSLKDISALVDFVAGLKVKRKYLLVQMPAQNTTLLQEKKINFNVFINEIGLGMRSVMMQGDRPSRRKFILQGGFHKVCTKFSPLMRTYLMDALNCLAV